MGVEEALSGGRSEFMLPRSTLCCVEAPAPSPFYQMKDKVRNKLSKRQHEDEASWSTRSWLSLQAQRMSVALQLAAAEEIATELRLAAASEDAAVA